MNTTTTAAGAKKWNDLSNAAKEAVLDARRAARALAVEGDAAYEAVFGDALDALMGEELSVYGYLGALLDATGDAPTVYRAACRAAEVMAATTRRAGP